MIRVIVFAFAIVGLSACASAPVNFGKPDPSSRIGMIYLIDEHPKHSHVGTTAFQNFDTPSATKTDFRSQFAARCTDLLSRAGYDLRTIEATEQLSGMEMMAVDPVQRVVAPRFLAAFLSMPLLAAIFSAVGIFGGHFVGKEFRSPFEQSVKICHGMCGMFICAISCIND